MLKFFLKRFTKMYETYNKVSDVFAEPTVHFEHGKWTKVSGLPVWRRGAIIYFGKHNEYDTEHDWYGAWAGHTKWNEDFLKTCSKFGRFWRKFIKPTYQLPMWTAFYIMNSAEWVKPKEDCYSFEYPPQFSIVLFGYCFYWTLCAPRATTDFIGENTGKSYPDNDDYWESIYDYLYEEGENKMQLACDCVKMERKYSVENWKKFNEIFDEAKKYAYDSEEHKKLFEKLDKLCVTVCWLRCRPEYIKKEHIREYYEEFEKVKNNKKYRKHIWL